jgi:hypothetical protein
VIAPQHPHLEFELVLNENHGPYSSTEIIEGQKEGHHTGIFVQLAAGEYHLKLAFLTEPELLQIPC